MNPETSVPSTTLLHCQHRSASGRRFCRQPIADAQVSLCFKHAAAQKKDRDAANLAVQLIGDTQEFTSAVAINRSLGELYKLLARDEIAPRRAAVMAYTGSLLLRTLPAIEHELGFDPEEDIRVELGDMPRPNYDWPDPSECAAYRVDLGDLPCPDRSSPEASEPPQIQSSSRMLP